MESKIAQAQTKKLGIWSQGAHRVSAAEHKRVNRNGQAKGAPSLSFAAAGTLHDLTNSPKVAREVRGGSSGGGNNKPVKKKKNENGLAQKKKKDRSSGLLEAAVTGLEVVG